MGRTAKKKIAILDEGVLLTADADSIDFTGAGVSGTVLGDDVEEEITGGGDPSEFVPYTGATGDVDLDENDLIFSYSYGVYFRKSDNSLVRGIYLDANEDDLTVGDSTSGNYMTIYSGGFVASGDSIQFGANSNVAPTGDGGYISFSGGDAGVGTDANGGDITYQLGAKDGSGTHGKFKVKPKGGSTVAWGILDFDALDTTDRTFAFQDKSGTLALMEDLVYVSATPPGSPEVNDLWYDIS